MSRPDDAAFTRLMQTHTPRLWAAARAFASSDDDAEDLLQELWLRVHERWADCPHDDSTGAWLHVVLLNLARARWRRQARRARLLAWWHRPAASDARAVPTVKGALTQAALWRAIAALPRRQRDILLRRVVADESTHEVAEALAVSEGTVKTSLHRALRTLRRILEDT